MRDCRPLVIAQIASAQLIEPNPNAGVRSRFDLNRLDLKGDPAAPADFIAVVSDQMA
jgi:hypothetical protein